MADRLEITGLPIEDNRPKELNSTEQQTFQTAILGTEIPQGDATAERWLERGNQFWRLQRYNEAVEAFDQAIALEPEFIHLAYYGNGLALWAKEKYEAALGSFELATEAQANFAPAFLYKSSVLQNLNRPKEALVAIEQAISLQDNNANLYSLKAFILLKLKRYPEAGAAYNQAIKLNPRSVFYHNRGNLYSDQGKPELALSDYQSAIALDPNLAEAYANLSLLYMKMGNTEAAKTNLQKSQELFIAQGNTAGAEQVANLLQQSNTKTTVAQSETSNSEVIAINPNDAYAYYNRGLLYYDLKNYRAAISNFNQVIKFNPNDADAYYYRANAYGLSGDDNSGIADLKKAVELYQQQGNKEGYQKAQQLLQEVQRTTSL